MITRPQLFLACFALCLTQRALSTPLDDYVRAVDVGLNPEVMALGGVVGKTIDQLRDPRSAQVADVFTKVSVESATGCMEFRAKNGFGGYNVSHSVWVLTVKSVQQPKLLFTIDNTTDWNKWCSGKGFKDRTAAGKEAVARLTR